jgi:hypothetical protein
VGEILGDLAAPLIDQPVYQADDEVGDELLIGLEPLVGEELREESPVLRVLIAVHRSEMFGPRHVGAVKAHLFADVIAMRRERQGRDGPGHRDRRGKRRAVRAQHFERLIVARDHEYAVVRLAEHRTLGP